MNRRVLVVILTLLIGYWLITSQYLWPETAPPIAQPSFKLDSAAEIFQYLHWTNSTSCKFAVDVGFAIYNGSGLAAPDGHKAVCFDSSVAPVYGRCLVYSFGINNQWSFDEGMEKFGCEIYAFDPSMKEETHNRSERIHFYKIGLTGQPDYVDPVKNWSMKTASSIHNDLLRHQSSVIDVLKMDVEFDEWDALRQMLRSGFLTAKVKQLAVEIHLRAEESLVQFQQRVRILMALESIGRFVRFSSRPNPWMLRRLRILSDRKDYSCFELAWYNSRFYNSSITQQLSSN